MPGTIEELQPREFATGAEETKAKPPAFHGDPIFYRGVAAALGLIGLGSLLSIAVLSGLNLFYPHGNTPWAVPESLTALGSASVGALAGLFTGSHAAR